MRAALEGGDEPSLLGLTRSRLTALHARLGFDLGQFRCEPRSSFGPCGLSWMPLKFGGSTETTQHNWV